MRKPEPAMHPPLQRLMSRHALPGVQYAFAVGGVLRVEECVGVADALGGVPLTPDTTFNLYSITKPFTARAVQRLAAQGHLTLETPIAQAAGEPALAGHGTVTQTLRHQAGFANPMPLRWTHRAADDARFDEPGFVRSQLARAARRMPRPGRTAYSNIGYLALGRAIERATGLGFRDALRALVLDALGLQPGETLGFAADDATHAHGHLRRFGLLDLTLGLLADRREVVDATDAQWVRLHHHRVNGSAYGGLIGNARGLLRAGQSLLAQRLVGFEGTLNGQPWIGHAGGGLGHYGEWRVYPRSGAVSVLLTNRAGLRDRRWLDLLDPPTLTKEKS